MGANAIYFSPVFESGTFVAINAADSGFRANFNAGCGKLTDLITGEEIQCDSGIDMPGFSAYFLTAK